MTHQERPARAPIAIKPGYLLDFLLSFKMQFTVYQEQFLYERIRFTFLRIACDKRLQRELQ